MSGSGSVTNWALFDRSVGSGIEVTHTNVRKGEYKNILLEVQKMLNQIIIMGRCVETPTLRQTSTGVPVSTFRIACDRDKQTEGGQKADFVDIACWRKTAEFVTKYFAKGKPILIQGRLQIREWTDKEGKKRYSTEILADSVFFCGGDKVQNATPAPVPAPDMGVVPEFTDEGFGADEDLPWEDHDMK